MDTKNLLTAKEAAEMARMSPELFRYYVEDNRAPKPFMFKERAYYTIASITGWQPKQKPLGRKPKKP